jgi:hypothetical protein
MSDNPKQTLIDRSEQLENLRLDWLFDENLTLEGIVESKFLQALALLEQASCVLKEASYHS